MLNQKLIALLPDLAAFILVVDEGSFTAAAKKLNVTPSALSKLITRLEHALSVKLFERTTRSLAITESGKKVYEQSVAMVNAAQQAIAISEADHTELAGSITVAAPEAYLNSVLQPHILPFLEHYPDIQLKLRAVDGDIDLNQNIDIAFRLTDKPHENQVLKEIRKTNLVLCASPAYLTEKGTPKHPTQLERHDCLYLAETPNDHIWDFLKDDEFFTVAVSGRYAVNHSQMRLAGVKSGLGIGIFHDFVVKEALRDGSVVEVLSDWTLKSNYHGAVAMQYAQTKYMPARLRVFIDYIVEKLAE
ncbi:putative LysR family transcriptional regulator [Vibrio nigripulchritudo SFn27]|uniref:Putative LysR family transcriptional regulator n=1 Tax=Vibrio nigripulchritudo TaxID=28173 RepID=U4KDA8_9VIBR|nr:LysR family transcriptional regulator [Vibrio nigripulchritudo]CCN81637.1 putative LysR family transcriptional regulator [Vibrio nigripulchritudo BLFn1]CCN91734.1 putative LysR family transcriptional regulator [Vibrio nigripulchritudo SFn27]CCN96618.1 putative LysR family transcriptional regulator [Vibrio nigripulchritudo ENn2]CCO38492.1 putative LysR family transcriptional regulator [Vibrio nigripulchritudo SFn135]CCO53949.1 putative LysR family transcriptional regulator [Vibrio nigripulch